MSWLKNLFGGKNASSSAKKRPAAKTYNPPSNRAALLKEAMAIQERGRAHVQAVLEKTFAELSAKPPKPSDQEAMTRLLELRRAVLAMRRAGDHEGQRAKVLAGVKGLMGGPPKPKP